MSTRVTITFTVADELLNNYSQDMNNFLDALADTGIQGVSVQENKDFTGVHADKVALAEIDSELFFDEISMDTKSWSFDYDDLAENTKVFEYVKEYYPKELKALKNKEIDYLEIYSD